MKTVVFHCGTFKTGSSAIQNTAYSSRDLLREAGWLYPEAGLITNEPDVGYRHTNFVYDHAHNKSRWRRYVRDLIEEITYSGCDSVLLSSEAWSRSFAWPSLRELMRALEEAGVERFQGIILFRNCHDYARSMYREFTRRRGNVLPFSEYIRVKKDAFDLPRMANELNTIFLGNMTFIPFNGKSDVVEEFFESIDAPYNKIDDNKTINRGWNSVDTETKRIFNKHDMSVVAGYPGIENLFKRLGVTLDPELYSEIVPDGLLDYSPEGRDNFQRVTKWPDDLVDELLQPCSKEFIDISLLTPYLELMLKDWICFSPEEHKDKGGTVVEESFAKRLKRFYWRIRK